MGNLKRVIASITLGALLITSITACGSSKKDEPTPTNSASSSDSGKQELKPYQLSWYVIGGGQQKDTPAVEEEVNKYIKDKINATLKITTFDWGTYDQKLNAMIAAGEAFDMFFTCSWAADYRVNSLKGALLPLNDLIDKYAPKTKALVGPEFLNAASVNGKIYAIPANKEKAQGTGVIFRKDLLDKYNMDVSNVKSLQDLEPLFKIIKEKEPGVFPLEANGSDSPSRINADVDSPAPGCYVAEDGKTIKRGLDNPRYIDVIRLTNKWYKAGYIRPDAATIKDVTPDRKAGKTFTMFVQLKPGKDVELGSDIGFPLKQVVFNKPTITNGDISGSMQGISRTSKDPARALMFLELFNTDKYLNNLINFGIEGKHYSKVSDNVIDLQGGSQGKDSNYNPGTPWMFGNVFLTYLNKNDAPDKWKQYEDWNAKAVYAPSVGFVFNPDQVKTEVAALANVEKEFSGITSGAYDPDTYLAKYKEKQIAAGVDKIVAECQKQYDEFLKTKK